MTSDLPAGAAGLSEAEARARLARDGPNRLPPPQHKSFAAALLTVALLALRTVALLTCLLADALFTWRDGSWTAGLLVGLPALWAAWHLVRPGTHPRVA